MPTLPRPPTKKPRRRPANVPSSATWDYEESFWVDGPTDDRGRHDGLVTSYWPDGLLCARFEKVGGEFHGEVLRYHHSGEVAQRFTMVHGVIHGERTFFFTDGPTYEIGRPPGLAARVKRTVMVYDMGQVTAVHHFDGTGQEVDPQGRAVPAPRAAPPPPADPRGTEGGPPPDAVRVTRGSVSRVERWRASEAQGSRQITRFWRPDGRLALRLEHEGDELLSLTEHAETDEARVTETFLPGRSPDHSRPRPTRTVVETSEGRWDFAYAEGRCVAVSHAAAGAEPSAVTGPEVHDVATFAEAFQRRFAGVLDVRPASLWFEGCAVVHLELEAVEEPVPLTALTGDGGGNSAVVVTGGEHAGRVFFHDHEEGPALDAEELHAWLASEAEADVDAMSVDARVEALPFFENALADSLADFLAGIVVGSEATYWGAYSEFQPVDGDDR